MHLATQDAHLFCVTLSRRNCLCQELIKLKLKLLLLLFFYIVQSCPGENEATAGRNVSVVIGEMKIVGFFFAININLN
jgi:hypothetical protein